MKLTRNSNKKVSVWDVYSWLVTIISALIVTYNVFN